jgi:hypothetical protein
MPTARVMQLFSLEEYFFFSLFLVFILFLPLSVFCPFTLRKCYELLYFNGVSVSNISSVGYIREILIVSFMSRLSLFPSLLVCRNYISVTAPARTTPCTACLLLLIIIIIVTMNDTAAVTSVGTWVAFSRVKRPVPESVHLPASNAEVMNEWSYIFCPAYAVISCTVTIYFTTTTTTTTTTTAAAVSPKLPDWLWGLPRLPTSSKCGLSPLR